MVFPPMHRTVPVVVSILALSLVGAGSAAGAGAPEERAGTERFVPARTDTTYNLYFGVFHSHSSYSDGVGTPAEAFTFARDVSGIDFLGVSDHHNQLDADEYADVLAQADAFTEDGVFVALAAQEWTGHSPETGYVDHAVVLEADHVFEAAEDDLAAFYEELAATECLAIFAHPSDYGFDNFAYSTVGDAWVGACEVRHDAHLAKYEVLLANGWRLGTAGGEDTHDGTWGDGPRWTVALAPALTKTDILDAVANHRTYSTRDGNLELVFRIDGHWMGDAFAHVGNLAFEIAVSDADEGDAIDRIELHQNGQLLQWTRPGNVSCEW